MLNVEELATINEHLQKAEKKHPDFVPKVVDESLTISDAQCLLENNRSILRDYPTADNVIACENAEAMEAFVFGDYEKAIDEYYDAIAANIRAIRLIQTISNKGE